MANPVDFYWMAVKHILRYLKRFCSSVLRFQVAPSSQSFSTKALYDAV